MIEIVCQIECRVLDQMCLHLFFSSFFHISFCLCCHFHLSMKSTDGMDVYLFSLRLRFINLQLIKNFGFVISINGMDCELKVFVVIIFFSFVVSVNSNGNTVIGYRCNTVECFFFSISRLEKICERDLIVVYCEVHRRIGSNAINPI